MSGRGTITYGILTAVGGVALALLAFVELLLLFPVVWWLYAGVSVAFVVSLTLALRLRGHGPLYLAPALGLLVAWGLYLLPWSSRKPFLRDLRRVDVGMTPGQVRDIMADYREGTGLPYLDSFAFEPTGSSHGGVVSVDEGEIAMSNSLIFRHSDEGAFNADWGIVEFAEGRVLKVDFSAD